jgi:hypothetical protein
MHAVMNIVSATAMRSNSAIEQNSSNLGGFVPLSTRLG